MSTDTETNGGTRAKRQVRPTQYYAALEIHTRVAGDNGEEVTQTDFKPISPDCGDTQGCIKWLREQGEAGTVDASAVYAVVNVKRTGLRIQREVRVVEEGS